MLTQVKPAVDLVTVRSTLALSSSFSAGLMRVPAVISKVPTLRPCQPFRARSFPPVLAGQTSTCFLYACVTGRDRDSGGLRKAPTSPASGLLNLQPISSNFNQCSIYVQSMFISLLYELPFVRVLVTQAVMFNAMLCELLFVRVLHVPI